jgi:hypothetical protein
VADLIHSLRVIHKKTSRRCALATLFWMLAAMARGGTPMDSLALARERLERAAGLRGVLDAAHQAFQAMLPVIMAQQDRARPDYCAFVMAGASAGHGRFALAAAPSLPASPRALTLTASSETALAPAEAAAAVTDLSDLLVRRLTDAMPASRSGADGLACREAARHAGNISDLLSGAAPR